MNMKTEIYMIHSYGAWQITFKKTFNLPFVPFIGLFILDEVEDNEVQIELADNKYVRTIIYYFPKQEMFTVDIREHWREPVTDETIDDILKYFTACEWERRDDTDISQLKELMHKNEKF